MKELMKCTFDPTIYAGKPIGMFHCPECGEMVLAGLPHPDFDEPKILLTQIEIKILLEMAEHKTPKSKDEEMFINDLKNWIQIKE